MNFIELWFGLSPDGGNGTAEAIYIIAGLAVALAAVTGLRMRRARRN